MVGLQKHGGRNFLPSWNSPGWTFCLSGFLLAGLDQTGPSLRSADAETHWWTKARNAYGGTWTNTSSSWKVGERDEKSADKNSGALSPFFGPLRPPLT